MARDGSKACYRSRWILGDICAWRSSKCFAPSNETKVPNGAFFAVTELATLQGGAGCGSQHNRTRGQWLLKPLRGFMSNVARGWPRYRRKLTGRCGLFTARARHAQGLHSSVAQSSKLQVNGTRCKPPSTAVYTWHMAAARKYHA